MSKFDDFIAAYKDYEAACREVGSMPLDMESDEGVQAVPGLADKLKICRIIRNYIQHNTDYEGFLEVTKGQIKTLTDMGHLIRRKNGIVKDSDMYKSWAKAHAVTKDTSATECLSLIAKYGRIPVIDTDNTGGKIFKGLMDESLIVKILADAQKGIDAGFDVYQKEICKRYTICTIDGQEPVSRLVNHFEMPVIYVVKNGKKDTGWIIMD